MMTDMPDSPAHARTEPRGWTIPQMLLGGVLALLGAGIAGIAFYVMWGTVTGTVKDYMHGKAWTVPVAGEIAFTFMFLVGVLLAWRKAPPVVSRTLMMAGIMAGSVELNVYGAHGVLPDLTAHLVVVGAFFGVMLVGKAAFTALRGGKVRADRISAGEWVTHPLRSARLTWWMKAWGETSRLRAHTRYQRLLFALAVAQSDERVGRTPWLWRRRLPLTLRFQFSEGILPAPVTAAEDWQQAISAHVTGQLELLPDLPAGTPPEQTADAPAGETATATVERTGARQPGGQPAGQQGASQDATELASKRATARRMLSARNPRTVRQIAEHTGLSERTVGRIKSELPPRQLHAVDG